MSSEMREKHAETLKAVRSVFDGIPAPCAERDALDFAIALLARTEAGADGAVAWLCEWTDEDDGETVRVSFEFKRGAENRALEVGGDARVIPLYTHPQDASGDAEDAARWRHVRKDGLIWRVNMLALAKDDIDILFGAKADAAVDAAMQAKEAK